MQRRGIIVLLLVALLAGTGLSVPSAAPVANARQTDTRPFILPMKDPPGHSTWLYGQPFGNTTGAARFGSLWYEAGQGLHFGLDFPMACGTEIVAAASGTVSVVDGRSFGSGPHNMVIRHDRLNMASLYGHLLERPDFERGDYVEQGQVIGLSGDPDETCDSRPHLHFEIRAYDYRTVYNPAELIDANWSMLMTIGAYSYPFFQRDLYNARRWMTNDDQPDVQIGGRRLNLYRDSLPRPSSERPPTPTAIARTLPPLVEGHPVTQRQLTEPGCCVLPWWHPGDPQGLYMIDGAPEQRASIYRYDLVTDEITFAQYAPPPFYSADGSHVVERTGNNIRILRTADDLSWFTYPYGNATPGISPDNNRLLWVQQVANSVPGSQPPTTYFRITDMNGAGDKVLRTHPGGDAFWLDPDRVLLVLPEINNRRKRILMVQNVVTDHLYSLGAWYNLRGLSIAPGGEHLIFYVAFDNTNEANNGMYLLPTAEGSTVQRLDWFGGWQWRDSGSVLYIPFEPERDTARLAYYNIRTGQTAMLDAELSIKDGDWQLSPDGTHIVYLNAEDDSLWLLEIDETPVEG